MLVLNAPILLPMQRFLVVLLAAIPVVSATTAELMTALSSMRKKTALLIGRKNLYALPVAVFPGKSPKSHSLR